MSNESDEIKKRILPKLELAPPASSIRDHRSLAGTNSSTEIESKKNKISREHKLTYAPSSDDNRERGEVNRRNIAVVEEATQEETHERTLPTNISPFDDNEETDDACSSSAPEVQEDNANREEIHARTRPLLTEEAYVPRAEIVEEELQNAEAVNDNPRKKKYKYYILFLIIGILVVVAAIVLPINLKNKKSTAEISFLTGSPSQAPSLTVVPTETSICNFNPGFSCSVCGIGKYVSDPNATYYFPDNSEVFFSFGQQSIQCGKLESAGLDGSIPLSECAFLSFRISNVCRCVDCS